MIKALFVATLSLGLAATAAAAPADQPRQLGRCLFKVDGKVIVNGPCDIQLDPSEPTYIKISKLGGAPDEWIAYAIDKWTTWHHWHATKVGLDGRRAIFGGTTDYPLGKTTRKGNCWSNKRTTLCGEVLP